MALSRAALLQAKLTLPKGVVHVISDVHGEDRKLRHVINNASGSLRPLVEEVFAGQLTAAEQKQLLALVYYPREVMRTLPELQEDPAVRSAWVRTSIRRLFAIIRRLSGAYPREEIRARIPQEYRDLFRELLVEPFSGRDESFVNEMLVLLTAHQHDLDAVHSACRLVRNLAVAEIIVAGDLGDRGPRIDRVIDFLRQQPRVALVWGNHDVTWMGACLGHEALIATVLRMSLRYQRLWQLEEGYGIILSPLEKLARDVYGDDPAEHFLPHGTGLREPLLVARMHKAAAILEFKLTERMILRHPEWQMEDRLILQHIDPRAGTVRLGNAEYPLLDSHFPTLDPNHPHELTTDERRCMDRLRESFTSSARLWEHMDWMARNGAMSLVRDHVAIFHACMPVDETGSFLPLEVEGTCCAGRGLFTALEQIVRRAYRKTASHAGEDADWFWYLWAGPRSPLFGKDRMTTFERCFVADKSVRKETKNPYFHLLNDAAFAARIAAEMGVESTADTPMPLVVNGHVPVQPEKGELPVKQGGNAVTIDGAFSEVYGDRGYTLVLSPDRVTLAEHHHFESVEEVIQNDADIVPKITTVLDYLRPRLIADTEEGTEIRGRLQALTALATAYQDGRLRERKG